MQKSIGNLYSLGVRSGLTMTSTIGNFGKGYLFLNSSVPNAYDQLSDGDYLIICILKMLLSSSLNRFFCNFLKVDKQYSNIINSEKNFKGIYNVPQLSQFLEDNIQLNHLSKIQFTSQIELNLSFFIQEFSLAYLLKEIFSNLVDQDSLLVPNVEFLIHGDRVVIKVFPGSEVSNDFKEHIMLIAPLLGFSIHFGSDYFDVCLLLEIASEEEISNGYSTFVSAQPKGGRV